MHHLSRFAWWTTSRVIALLLAFGLILRDTFGRVTSSRQPNPWPVALLVSSAGHQSLQNSQYNMRHCNTSARGVLSRMIRCVAPLIILFGASYQLGCQDTGSEVIRSSTPQEIVQNNRLIALCEKRGAQVLENLGSYQFKGMQSDLVLTEYAFELETQILGDSIGSRIYLWVVEPLDERRESLHRVYERFNSPCLVYGNRISKLETASELLREHVVTDRLLLSDDGGLRNALTPSENALLQKIAASKHLQQSFMERSAEGTLIVPYDAFMLVFWGYILGGGLAGVSDTGDYTGLSPQDYVEQLYLEVGKQGN